MRIGLTTAAACLAIAAAAAAPFARSAGPVAVAPAYIGPPSSIVVLGHSVPAAWNSDPARPGVDSKQNSWATGSNPDVRSVYSRILALNPRIRGRNTNLAQDGADVNAVEQQAVRAANLRGSLKPELVVIQVMDNDIRCDGSDTSNYLPFRRTLTRVFDILARSVPDARIFLISQLGTSDTLADAIQTTAASRAAFSGHGPCDFFDPGGSRNETHIKYMDAVISGYEQQLVAVCRAFAHCRYGNMHPYIDTIANLSPDYNHFSVSGQAGIAAVAWSQMFDFTDLTPPVSQITLTRSSQGAVAQLTATDNVRVSGIEYTLTAPGRKTQPAYRAYRSPVRIKKGWTFTWRAVDSNGNSEQTRSIRS